MTSDQILGVLRAILAAVGGILSLAPVVWSFIANRPASIAASAQKIDGVNVVTSSAASPAVADAVAAAKANA